MLHLSVLVTEAVYSSEVLGTTYKSAWWNSAEDNNNFSLLLYAVKSVGIGTWINPSMPYTVPDTRGI
jgi:hypothetical protein